MHHALPCWTRPTWAFLIIISCSINIITHCIYKNLMIFCLKSIVPHPDCLFWTSHVHYHNVTCIISLSCGGLWAAYHVVSISPHRFFLGNWKLGLESAHQKESIGTIFMSCALNLSWNNIFQGVFFENPLFGCFKLKYTFYKNCHFWLSSTVEPWYMKNSLQVPYNK